MKFVKLTARPDTWFKEGTEVFQYDAEYDIGERMSLDEYNTWSSPCICVRGIHFVETGSYEEKLFGTGHRIDGECCSLDEFDVEFVSEKFGKVEII